jgi:hypothetical protein
MKIKFNSKIIALILLSISVIIFNSFFLFNTYFYSYFRGNSESFSRLNIVLLILSAMFFLISTILLFFSKIQLLKKISIIIISILFLSIFPVIGYLNLDTLEYISDRFFFYYVKDDLLKLINDYDESSKIKNIFIIDNSLLVLNNKELSLLKIYPDTSIYVVTDSIYYKNVINQLNINESIFLKYIQYLKNAKVHSFTVMKNYFIFGIYDREEIFNKVLIYSKISNISEEDLEKMKISKMDNIKNNWYWAIIRIF